MLEGINKILTFALLRNQSGIVAEWLGSALQKLLQRFESARYLQKKEKSREASLRDF